MDSVVYYRSKYAKQMEDSCGKELYWKYKPFHDEFIENWINCYVFKDYVDLTECNQNQLILRAYEACGVPRYDDHIYTCGAHSWFCYNTYPAFMLWHNYLKIKTNQDVCTGTFPWYCRNKHLSLMSSLLSDPKELWIPKYPGSTRLILYPELPIETAYCFPEFYFEAAPLSGTDAPNAPGNPCSKRLYSDCMVTVLVDDKTPPVAINPQDKFWYCDNVSSDEDDRYEYARCDDESWSMDNAKDKMCTDEKGIPYNQIESIKLNKYAYHSPVFVILDDIRRIQNLESKELFNSYKHFFNTPNDLINYKNIFSIVDFLEEQRKSLLEMQNNYQVTITNYKKQLKPYLEDIIVEVLLFLDKIQGSEAQNELQLSLFFKSILTKLNELKDEDNLRAKDDLNNNFEKYLNILEEVIKISIEKYKAFYKREEILKLSRKAIITIYDINNESTNALNHFENFAQECNHYLEKLDNRITDLKSFAEN